MKMMEKAFICTPQWIIIDFDNKNDRELIAHLQLSAPCRCFFRLYFHFRYSPFNSWLVFWFWFLLFLFKFCMMGNTPWLISLAELDVRGGESSKFHRMNFVISCLHCAFCFDQDEDDAAAVAVAVAAEWFGRTALYSITINGIISKCQRHTRTHTHTDGINNFMFGVHRPATTCFRFKFNLVRLFHRNCNAIGNFFLASSFALMRLGACAYLKEKICWNFVHFVTQISNTYTHTHWCAD